MSRIAARLFEMFFKARRDQVSDAAPGCCTRYRRPSRFASRTRQGMPCARSAPASFAMPAGSSQGFAMGGKIRSMENRVQGQGSGVKLKVYNILSSISFPGWSLCGTTYYSISGNSLVGSLRHKTTTAKQNGFLSIPPPFLLRSPFASIRSAFRPFFSYRENQEQSLLLSPALLRLCFFCAEPLGPHPGFVIRVQKTPGPRNAL